MARTVDPERQEKVLTALRLAGVGLSIGEVWDACGKEYTRSEIWAALKRLRNDGLAQVSGHSTAARWSIPGEQPLRIAGAPSPDQSTKRSIEQELNRQAKVRMETVAIAPKIRPKAAQREQTGSLFEFAIDQDGVLGIASVETEDKLRLQPAAITELVDFLERTQHVWKRNT